MTHVAIRSGPRGNQIDEQTAAGIAQWCRHFDRVTYYGIADEGMSENSVKWVDVSDIPFAERCEVLALPRGYRPRQMAREYRGVRDTLRKSIASNRHLCFTVGGLIGDWPAVAARESARQKRRYAAWIDRVEPFVIRNKMAQASLRRRLAAAIAIPMMELYTQHVLRHSTVALLQGRDTFDHYSGYAKAPYCTYDTHTTTADEIGGEALAKKQDRIRTGAPLRIVYVGRAAAMKGPDDWLSVLEHLRRNGIPFRASWIGDGPELANMRQRISKSGMLDVVQVIGFQGDREEVLAAMRSSDLMMFCHKTLESPRCLIESLVCGCPLVGYESAYARGLVEEAGGGLFVSQDSIEELADCVSQLHENRNALSELAVDAAASGRKYNEDAVYAHRADLMRRG